MHPVLDLVGIVRSFGPVHALRGADFVVQAGEIHALLGENGAGKSTLMRIAYGLDRADAGVVRVHGREGALRSPLEARRLGVGMVHQHFTSITALTVAENIALAAGWPVAPRALGERVRRLGDAIGLPLDPHERAGALSAGLKQRLEIAKALATNARILLLDEPTAVLAPSEAEELLQVVRRFAEEGGSVVLITHRLEEALATADRVTVLRHGRTVLSGAASEHTARSLARAMMGESKPLNICHPERSERAEALRVSNPIAGPSGSGPFASLRVTTGASAALTPLASDVLIDCHALEVGEQGGRATAVHGVELEVRGGEIVGLAAVEGNGHRELLRCIAGRMRARSGRLDVAGPVAFVPEDRSLEGLIPDFTLAENLVLGLGGEGPWVRRGRIDWSVARARTRELMRASGVSTTEPDTRAGALSGGNQQKLIVARELSRSPRVIVAENPTRGLDVKAAAGVLRRFREAADAGAAVLFHSTDLDELMTFADRIFVVAAGRLRPMGRASSRQAIGDAMLGR